MGTYTANTFPRFGRNHFLHSLKKPQSSGSYGPILKFSTQSIFQQLLRVLAGRQVEEAEGAYLCWKCKEYYMDPAEYLWHIQDCTGYNSDRQEVAT